MEWDDGVSDSPLLATPTPTEDGPVSEMPPCGDGALDALDGTTAREDILDVMSDADGVGSDRGEPIASDHSGEGADDDAAVLSPLAKMPDRRQRQGVRRLIARRFSKFRNADGKHKAGLTAISGFWNKKHLHQGSHLVVRHDVPRKNRVRWHPKTWDPKATVVRASSLMNSGPSALSRDSHSELTVIACVALAQRHHRDASVEQWGLSIEVGGAEVPWLVVKRAIDFTQVNCHFGALSDLLRPVAKYWWRDDLMGTQGDVVVVVVCFFVCFC